MLTCDPRIVAAARPVPVLTYEEATELAFFGATVLHPLAMQPALQSQGLNVRYMPCLSLANVIEAGLQRTS